MNILLIYIGFFILLFIIIFVIQSIKIRNLSTKPRNNVHFYVARDSNGPLWLFMGKPNRDKVVFFSCKEKGGLYMGRNSELKKYGLNEHDYDSLKWEDEPVEVFINMED